MRFRVGDMAFKFSMMFIFIMVSSSLRAESNYPRIRAYIEPVENVNIGQTVKLYIEIERLDEQSGVPKYPEISIEGAVVLQPEQLGTSYSKTEKGELIVGVRQKFVIIPKRSGAISIPSLDIEWTGEKNLILRTGEIPMTVTTPAGVTDISRLIVGTDVTVRQLIEPDIKTLRIGDAIEQTITIVAGDTLGLTLPPPILRDIAGLGQYPKPPEIVDKSDRGAYRTKRIDTIVYIVEKKGTYTLPELSYEWFDIDTNLLKHIRLPAVKFDVVAANTETDLPISAAKETSSISEKITELMSIVSAFVRNNLVAFSITILGLGVIFLFRQQIRSSASFKIDQLRTGIKSTERTAFLKVIWACLRGDPKELRNTLWIWIEENQKLKGVATISVMEENLGVDHIQSLKDVLNGPFSLVPSNRTIGLIGLLRLRRNLQLTSRRTASSVEKYTLNPHKIDARHNVKK